jgi:hypothetical protein
MKLLAIAVAMSAMSATADAGVVNDDYQQVEAAAYCIAGNNERAQRKTEAR